MMALNEEWGSGELRGVKWPNIRVVWLVLCINYRNHPINQSRRLARHHARIKGLSALNYGCFIPCYYWIGWHPSKTSHR